MSRGLASMLGAYQMQFNSEIKFGIGLRMW